MQIQRQPTRRYTLREGPSQSSQHRLRSTVGGTVAGVGTLGYAVYGALQALDLAS